MFSNKTISLQEYPVQQDLCIPDETMIISCTYAWRFCHMWSSRTICLQKYPVQPDLCVPDETMAQANNLLLQETSFTVPLLQQQNSCNWGHSLPHLLSFMLESDLSSSLMICPAAPTSPEYF